MIVVPRHLEQLSPAAPICPCCYEAPDYGLHGPLARPHTSSRFAHRPRDVLSASRVRYPGCGARGEAPLQPLSEPPSQLPVSFCPGR